MRRVRSLRAVWLVVASLAFFGPPVSAQERTLVRDLDAVLTATAGTPDGQGLLPVAIAEAWRAVAAARAAAAATDLTAIQAQAEAVLAAVDPSLVPERGATHYGARRAVGEARLAVDAALADEPLVADIVRLRPQAQGAALQVEARLAALVASATRIVAAHTAAEAATEAVTLRRLAEAVVLGADVDGDGRATFAPGEPGLVQWRQALTVLRAHRAARSAVAVEAIDEVGR